jgi:Secretion system C-terminal sorting domain/PKD domain
MKKMIWFLIVLGSITTSIAYEKKTIIERFTNAACGPCAEINDGWYNSLTTNLINSDSITHVIYNVSWPSSSDPMYLFNMETNNNRRNYYGVSWVPWIDINGTQVGENENEVIDGVNTGNESYSPFKIVLTPTYYSLNIMTVHVKVIRDATDTTNPEDLRLRVAITEKDINYPTPPGSNGETEFFSVCRKMLPDDGGTSFEAPAIGDSTEFDLEFFPNDEFISTVDLKNLRVVAFIQNDSTKEMYQSCMKDAPFALQLEALFDVEEHIGVSPFTVNFNDVSTPTDSTSIISWEWDFNDDGVTDSEEQSPTWVFNDEGSYKVSLIVKDGIETFNTIINSFITVVGNTANILVVNGNNYSDNLDDMNNFYNNSVCFAGNNVDVWDLYGNQNFEYASNGKIQRTHFFNQHIPSDVLYLYDKVLWIGDNHMGDAGIPIGDQILDYIGQGGNFLLATKSADKFFNDNLKEYCGVLRFSPTSAVAGISAVDPNLVNQSITSINTNIQFARIADTSNAVPIFTKIGSTTWIAGFTIHKDSYGGFIYVGGSALMYDNTTTTQNFDYIIESWLRPDPIVSLGEDRQQLVVNEFKLEQNYPNPFNPNTTIKFAVPNVEALGVTNVQLKIFDILGREVKTLINENKKPGNYEVKFDATDLTSGIYYYKLSAGDFIETKKMILLK